MSKQTKVFRGIRRQLLKGLDDLAVLKNGSGNGGQQPPPVETPELRSLRAVEASLRETMEVLNGVIESTE